LAAFNYSVAMTKRPTILRIAVPMPLRQGFDYLPPEGCNVDDLQPGMRLKVPFGSRQLVGILLAIGVEPEIPLPKIKQAIEIIDAKPVISTEILALCNWAADYYHHPIGDVLDSALPTLLRQGKPAATSQETYWQLTDEGRQFDVSTLTRSPKQADIISWLRLHPDGVTLRQMKEKAIAAPALTALAKKGFTQKISQSLVLPLQTTQVESPLTLNNYQALALGEIIRAENTFKVFLLDGVTGSGKTEVYLQAITQTLARQQQILVLVPEIGLTPQTIQRFRQRFSEPVVALHSGLSNKERLNAWLLAANGTAKIIIGTRSAIFSPCANLGLVIVDEEHDLSFKQQEGFRYHARDLAIMRAQSLKIPVVLGSATPSLETIARAQQQRYQHLCLPERAGAALPPKFNILDIRNQYLEEGLSPALLRAMQEHLDSGSQVMLFLNRRGFAPVIMCHSCGWMAKCKRCDVRMTFHHDQRRLHCHHCDSRRPLATNCEDCNAGDLQIIGLGTERLEIALQKHFPHFNIARIDRDSTQKKGSMEALLASIHSGEANILIGTQMLAKGHHFPDVTLVGIIDADSGFFSADFRAIERMGQLVLQVAGRAGRATKPGTVMIQTHHPDHPHLQQLVRDSYQMFAASLLQEREHAAMPPYAFLALFRAEAHSLMHAEDFLKEVKQLASRLGENVPIFGPVPAPMPKRAGKFRVQLLVQALQRPILQRYLKRLLPEIEKLASKQKVRWSLDVDPAEMF
jgi:primosomal protein N' (replication factor Y)